MNIGYACLTIGVPGTRLRTCTLKNANTETLKEITAANLAALEQMLEFNAKNNIHLFRVSSDIIPFASHPKCTLEWDQVFRIELRRLGEKARSYGMRLSMHPGQYTVLNSPDQEVVRRAVADLTYHSKFLDALEMGPECKLILHIGGAYGDKEMAANRFLEQYDQLSDKIRKRLVLENDDKIFAIDEVLAIGLKGGIPVVFDNLHHQVKLDQARINEFEWIAACAKTWEPEDGPQKIHYSQQAPGKRQGSHSDTVKAEEFLSFYENIPGDPDIMLEVKDKNLSAIKCIAITTSAKKIRLLEEEWARYKYAVLERTPAVYQKIRELLKDKKCYPAEAFYTLIEEALEKNIEVGAAVNAAQHVWGYFKENAADQEKLRFTRLLEKYQQGSGTIKPVKRLLFQMAEKYGHHYLLESYYFHLDP